MKRIFGAMVLGLVGLVVLVGAASGAPVTVTADPVTAALVAPTNFLASNTIAGAGITITKGAGGKITISGGGVGSGSIVGATNQGMLNPSSIGLDRGTNGGLIQLASLIAGNNITLTDNGTNIAITAAVLTGAGIVNLNGQEGVNQTFSTGSGGTDFTIVSSGNNHEFRIPNASPTSRGLLSSADYSMLLMKQASSMILSNIVGNGGAITNLNGQTGASQTFSVSALGPVFAIVSSGDNHEFRMPFATTTNSGLLSAISLQSFMGRQWGDPGLTNLANLSGVGYVVQESPDVYTTHPLFFGVTNVFNAANGAGMVSLVGVTNAPGSSGNARIKTLSQGANITITDNATNLIIASAAGVGEANVNGEISVTNATRHGLVHSKVGITNMLRSVSAGNGLSATNQGTNLVFAVTQSNLVGLANNVLTNVLVYGGTNPVLGTLYFPSLTPDRVLVLPSPGNVASAIVTIGELNSLSGMVGSVAGELANKQPLSAVLNGLTNNPATTWTNANPNQFLVVNGTGSIKDGAWLSNIVVHGTLTVSNDSAGVITLVATNGLVWSLQITNAPLTNIVVQTENFARQGLWYFLKTSHSNLVQRTVRDDSGSVGQFLALTSTGPAWSNSVAGAGAITVQTNGTAVGTGTTVNFSSDGDVYFGTNTAGAIQIHHKLGGLRWQTNGVDGSTQAVVNIVGTGAPIVSNNAAGNLTALIFNAAAAGGYRAIYIDAAAMVSSQTDGAMPRLEETSSNKQNADWMEFGTVSLTTNKAQFKIALPEQWDLGTVKAKFYWSSSDGTATQTNVFSIRAVAVSNDDVYDASWGTAQIIRDALIAQNDLHLTGATPAITIAGTPAAGDLIWFEVSRPFDHVDDTMTGKAKLFGVAIQYQETLTPGQW